MFRFSCGMLRNRSFYAAWRAIQPELVVLAGMNIFFPGTVASSSDTRDKIIIMRLSKCNVPPPQWRKIRTHSPSWCEGGRPSHLHAHWSFTGGVWATVVPGWTIPGQRRQWQLGVCMASCPGWKRWQQQPACTLLDWTPRSCQGERPSKAELAKKIKKNNCTYETENFLNGYRMCWG